MRILALKDRIYLFGTVREVTDEIRRLSLRHHLLSDLIRERRQ